MFNLSSTQNLPNDPLALILARLETLESEIGGLRSDMEKGFRHLERRLDVVSVDINQVRADLHDHSSRIEKLEGERA